MLGSSDFWREDCAIAGRTRVKVQDECGKALEQSHRFKVHWYKTHAAKLSDNHLGSRYKTNAAKLSNSHFGSRYKTWRTSLQGLSAGEALPARPLRRTPLSRASRG